MEVLNKEFDFLYEDIDFYKSLCSIVKNDNESIEIEVSQITITNNDGKSQIFKDLLFIFTEPIYSKIKFHSENKDKKIIMRNGELDNKITGYDIFLLGADDMETKDYISFTIQAKECIIKIL